MNEGNFKMNNDPGWVKKMAEQEQGCSADVGLTAMTMAAMEATRHEKNIHRAIILADRIRREHNGIFYLTLGLTHDGNNACVLEETKYGRIRGEASTLYEAVRRAYSAWKMHNLLDFPERILELADLARERYCKEDSIFGIANFEAIIKDQYQGLEMTVEHMEHVLDSHPKLVRIKGGDHWYILPSFYERDMRSED